MKTVILALAFLATASATPVSSSDLGAVILKQEGDVNPDGSYQFSYETSNGIVSSEQGVLKNAGNPDAEAEEIAGGVSYTAPDGTQIKLSYVANENGFQPIGDHLPVPPVDDNTPPPIPLAILRSLEYNAAHPEKVVL